MCDSAIAGGESLGLKVDWSGINPYLAFTRPWTFSPISMTQEYKEPSHGVLPKRVEAKEALRFPPGVPQTEPIHLSGAWIMESTEQADALLGGAVPGFVYRRDGHPNAASLADALRIMHGADQAMVTAQGMSSISIAAMSLLKPGDRVLLGQPLYGRTSFFIKNDLGRWGIQFEDVDVTDFDAWKSALDKPARMVILETITNPRMSVPDIESICKLIHQAHGPAIAESGPVVMVDNTFATPALCQPLALGADLVVESLSKFVCGHADAMLGLLCGRNEIWGRMRQTMVSFGMTSSPLDCWLTHRGLASLNVRMAHAAASANELAHAIAGHPRVQAIDYPGLADHPDHQIAKKQFNGSFGNMLSIHLKGGLSSAQRFITAVADDIPFCPTLGEAQTTLSHPMSTSHRSYSPELLQSLGISGGTLRFSIGLEPTSSLIGKFLNGLNHCDD
jgi:cystathionine beta-lyase/cystathionine gamma-synthase